MRPSTTIKQTTDSLEDWWCIYHILRLRNPRILKRALSVIIVVGSFHSCSAVRLRIGVFGL
jgi:hypothetical protein